MFPMLSLFVSHITPHDYVLIETALFCPPVAALQTYECGKCETANTSRSFNGRALGAQIRGFRVRHPELTFFILLVLRLVRKRLIMY